jgi:hypothetical protein
MNIGYWLTKIMIFRQVVFPISLLCKISAGRKGTGYEK